MHRSDAIKMKEGQYKIDLAKLVITFETEFPHKSNRWEHGRLLLDRKRDKFQF